MSGVKNEIKLYIYDKKRTSFIFLSSIINEILALNVVYWVQINDLSDWIISFCGSGED